MATNLPVTSLSEIQALLNLEMKRLPNIETDVWATYSRLSQEDKYGHNYSLEIQPDRAEAYAREHGATKIVQYEDPFLSGKNSRRKDLQRLIKDIKAGRINYVVVHRLDRLYRNLSSLLKFIHLCKRHGVRIVSVTEQIDLESMWGRLVMILLGALAEMYVRQTSVVTSEALAKRNRKGLPNGQIAIGYCRGLCQDCTDVQGKGYCPLYGQPDRPESERGRIQVKHPIDQYLIVLIFDLYGKGWSFREIASHINRYWFELPEYGTVKFKPRGNLGKSSPKEFSHESIRTIIANPVYIGLVARYQRPVFSLEDDVENPDSIKPYASNVDTRKIIEINDAQHEGIISPAAWKRIQHIRKAKGKTPTTRRNPKRVYPLAGVAKCWECYQFDARRASFRGSSGGTGGKSIYYRCATIQNRSAKKKTMTTAQQLQVAKEDLFWDQLLERHTRKSYQAERLEAQVDGILTKFTIPENWFDTIIAYYLTDEGMTEFERETRNIRAALSRNKEFYEDGFIDKAEFKRVGESLARKLATLAPSAQPEADELLPWFKDFSRIWAATTNAERRSLLNIMFTDLFFDADGQLVHAEAHAPFDEMLSLPA